MIGLWLRGIPIASTVNVERFAGLNVAVSAPRTFARKCLVLAVPNLQTRPPILKYRPTRPDPACTCADRNNNIINLHGIPCGLPN